MKREIKCMSDIQSDHLVEFIECKNINPEGQNVLIIVEEFIEGKVLRGIINESPSLDLSIRVLSDLINLLILFNKNDIIHRDIKPENIIISDTRGSVLLDFGIARALRDTSITSSLLSMGPGTPRYAAPEQLQNQKDLQNIRTDLFACGIVFYETATGVHPFEPDSGDEEELLESIIQGKRKELQPVYPDVSYIQELEEIYLKLTNPIIHDRYRIPELVLKDLESITKV